MIGIGPLRGHLVLDLGFVGVGPIACTWLGMLGARVIKVEPPEGDPALQVGPFLGEMRADYLLYNMGKEGIVLDLKQDDDLQILLNMVRKADVFCVNWRPGQPERLGIGFDDLKKLNPRLVYVSSPGYGHRGPYRDMPLYDPWGSCIAGYASLIGQPGEHGELDRGALACDMTTSHTVVQGVLVALWNRQRTGRGQKVETSQLQATSALVQTRAAEFLAGEHVPRPSGSATETVVPSQAFAASDGWIAVSAETPAQWRSLCAVLDRPDLADDPRFRDNSRRVEHRDALAAELAARITGKTVAQWHRLLTAGDVPAGPFRWMRESRYDPYVREEKMVYRQELPAGSLDVGGPPWSFSGYETLPDLPLAHPGAHSEVLASEFGAAAGYVPTPWKGMPDVHVF